MSQPLSLIVTLALMLGLGSSVAQTPLPGDKADILTTARITQPALANGDSLPPGSYQLRLTNQYLSPLPGQSAEAERWVEFVKDGVVIGRATATVVAPDSSVPVGTTFHTGATAPRIEILKGGEVLRISVRRNGNRYLIHLPVAR